MKLEDHRLLAETGRDSAMGKLLRRYWTAALLSRELEAGGAPVRLRLMAEDLVAFRTADGGVGLLAEHCSHRGASLYFAKNEDCGLRCWYHGWKYDIDGNCIDMPNEPPQTQFKDKIRHRAYPCVEKNGVVWAYLGPRDRQPALPALEWLTVPESHVYVSKRRQRCHWTQGMEGDLDSAHLSILHNDLLRQRAADPRNRSAVWAMRELQPKLEAQAIPAGMLLAARRNAEAETCYWRVNQWFLPGYTNWPIPGDNPQAGHAWVPIDDENCLVFTFSWHPVRPLKDAERQQMQTGGDIHAQVDAATFEPLHNAANDYAGDGAPKPRQPWMGITKLQAQDIAMTESMGPLYDRTQENLSASDLVIAQARHRLIVAARGLAEGKDPPGLDPRDYGYRPVAMELPRDVQAWREAVAERMMATPETFQVSI
jgi:phenylpropionate dioxygenase-like ring-hydroxylating dioxygenase large terminal subunit